jgi:hypothetical protein
MRYILLLRFSLGGNVKRKDYTARSIEIPDWMNAALAELAYKHKRTVTGEIQHIVESWLVSEGFTVPEPGPVVRTGKTA